MLSVKSDELIAPLSFSLNAMEISKYSHVLHAKRGNTIPANFENDKHCHGYVMTHNIHMKTKNSSPEILERAEFEHGTLNAKTCN